MKKQISLLASLFFLFLFVSCGEEVDIDDNSESKPEIVNLERKLQRVIRYNCAGDVTSDEIETINSISKSFLISPDKKSSLWGFMARNLESGDGAGALWGSKGKFTIDIAPTVFNIQVFEGRNEIEYYFSYCDSIEETDESGRVCKSGVYNSSKESIFLDVRYTSRTLEGELELRPSAESCTENN